MAAKKQVLRDPRGGLTAAGRKHYAEKQGARLKPGVKGPADTPEKMRRKGSFLRRHYGHKPFPLVDAKGRPTRYALQAQAWGEKIPETDADVRRLARLGTELLKQYRLAKEKGGASRPRR
jgi:hypothetical protein